MKRALILLLIVITIAGYLGTLIARDPGYVLVVYDDYSMQTSIWVLIGLILGFSLIVYLLLKSFNMLRYSGAVIREWRAAKRDARVNRLSQKGLMLLIEGEFDRARKFLDGASEGGQMNAFNLLSAARAANGQGDHEARETYLRQAVESDPSLTRAASMLKAELALQRADAGAALAALAPVKPNRYSAELMLQALKLKGDWRTSMEALPALRKFLDTASFETEIALAGLGAEAGNDSELNNLFKSLSANLRDIPEVLIQYTRSLSYKAHAEPLLRAAIKRSWHPALVEAYGDADFDTLKARRKAAENWLKQHAEDASLHYCLGCLYELSNEPGLARESFTRSIELGGAGKAHEKLGLLLAQNGEFELGSQQLKLALAGSVDVEET